KLWDVVVSFRRLFQQADLLQIFRSDRERNRIADCLVEAVVRPILKEKRLVLVCALIKVMSELVVNGDEIFSANLNAHFDPQIVLVIDVPGARVTNDVAIFWLGEQRSI